ncbi:hypothetical protein [Mucilaginibacter sp. KACC 22063]|uniref:hypothetical protein n=1 Tax=Mucilaginibacter sp. KACC 22063 TaxID=3025666 RepID=UPI00236562B2|nr:hypothetical protein [Mucilaginibacter sp. KACC 22063]WDF56466.1 hypothetical protein PQ461_05300 [Mucilaginibacter sp. KACC 22063]
MAQELILQGRVLWSYDFEYAEINNQTRVAASLLSGIGPLHHHKGNIGLTAEELLIKGHENEYDLTIALNTIDEVYLDDIFTNTSVKNFGALWQPLRIRFYERRNMEKIYLIIDHNGLFTHNKQWYETLKSILV